jgi:sialate O-acetylesterase
MKILFRTALPVLFLFQSVFALGLRKEVNLSGRWRFTTGNDTAYANPKFDDSDWDKIRVPGIWEHQGYRNYNGYAWYRTRFNVSGSLKDEILILDAGTIDDVDRVYLNGRLIGGKGEFPPDYLTAYNIPRMYLIPNEILHFGDENCLAVQVYDDWGEGGFVSGRIGIYSESAKYANLDLTGNWKFHTGDDSLWSRSSLDDADWESIIVPGQWESQGHPDYDGYAWYRLKTTIPRQLSGEKLILNMGAVDDADEVYFNGVRIGRTGYFPAEKYGKDNEKFYNQERIYTLPSNLVRWGSENTLAVRVYDVWGEGGIYKTPVQIITQYEFNKHQRVHRNYDWNGNDNRGSFLDWIDSIFNGWF